MTAPRLQYSVPDKDETDGSHPVKAVLKHAVLPPEVMVPDTGTDCTTDAVDDALRPRPARRQHDHDGPRCSPAPSSH